MAIGEKKKGKVVQDNEKYAKAHIRSLKRTKVALKDTKAKELHWIAITKEKMGVKYGERVRVKIKEIFTRVKRDGYFISSRKTHKIVPNSDKLINHRYQRESWLKSDTPLYYQFHSEKTQKVWEFIWCHRHCIRQKSENVGKDHG